MDFFGGHGLGFDDPLDPLFLGESEDVLLHLFRIGGPEDLGSAAFRALLELFSQGLKVGGGAALDLRDLVPHGLEVDALICFGAADPIGLGEPAQGPGEVRIVEGGFDGFLELSGHAVTCWNSSTTTMMSRSGPCTPMVSTRSISAVRLGPVMKEM